MSLYFYILKWYSWFMTDERKKRVMPLKMIYDIDANKECMFPSSVWRREMQHWPEMVQGSKITHIVYPDSDKHVAQLIRRKPDMVSNIRFEVEYEYRDMPYNMISRRPYRDLTEKGEYDRVMDDLSPPKIITKVLAHYGDKIVWDTERFLRYAGPNIDFHDSKDILMKDLFEKVEETPDKWEVFLLTSVKPIVITKTCELNHLTLEQGRT